MNHARRQERYREGQREAARAAVSQVQAAQASYNRLDLSLQKASEAVGQTVADASTAPAVNLPTAVKLPKVEWRLVASENAASPSVDPETSGAKS